MLRNLADCGRPVNPVGKNSGVYPRRVLTALTHDADHPRRARAVVQVFRLIGVFRHSGNLDTGTVRLYSPERCPPCSRMPGLNAYLCRVFFGLFLNEIERRAVAAKGVGRRTGIAQVQPRLAF